MVEISSHNEKSLWMGCLLITDGAVKFTQCLVSIVIVTAGRDVDCNKQDGRKLPRWIERLAFDDHKLHKGSTMSANHHSVLTPSIPDVNTDLSAAGFTSFDDGSVCSVAS